MRTTCRTCSPRFRAEGDTLGERLGELERAIGSAVAAAAAAYGGALLDFWNAGLKLAPDDEICPMCEAPTLTLELREELSKRLRDSASAVASNQTLRETTEKAKNAVRELRLRISAFGANELSATDRTLLGNLLDEEATRSFIAEYDRLAGSRDGSAATLDGVDRFLNKCAERLADPTNAPSVVADAESARMAATGVAFAYADHVAAYAAKWCDFDQVLSERISKVKAVAQIDSVGRSIRAETAIRTLGRNQDVLVESQALIKGVESGLQAKQAALLSTRGGEVKTLYDLMNPGSDVGFDSMEPGTDVMRLHAKSFGRRMPAAANLSECQLNCLGLSVWIMQAITPSSPFGFIVLDDPIQSMDDNHAEAFLASVVPYLLESCNKQVIILSHLTRITDRLRDLYLSGSLRLLHYHFDSYRQAGPVITEQKLIAKLVAEIAGAASGNEVNREQAVDRMRVLAERIIRELHLVKTGAPLPPSFDNAMPSALLAAFRAIPETSPQEHAGMRDTVRFCDPAHHSEVGYTVPQSSNITPHLDRLKGLIRKYQLAQ